MRNKNNCEKIKAETQCSHYLCATNCRNRTYPKLLWIRARKRPESEWPQPTKARDVVVVCERKNSVYRRGVHWIRKHWTDSGIRQTALVFVRSFTTHSHQNIRPGEQRSGSTPLDAYDHVAFWLVCSPPFVCRLLSGIGAAGRSRFGSQILLPSTVLRPLRHPSTSLS